MKNKNPLLVPGLSETLAAGDAKILRDFRKSKYPTGAGECEFICFRNAVRVFIQSRSVSRMETSISTDCRVNCCQARNCNPMNRRVAP
jgi:hypothetical protein